MKYDALGRVTILTNPMGEFDYAYEGTSDRLLRVFHEGFTFFYIYYDNSKDRRLKEITNEEQDVVRSDFFYAYLSEGEIYKIKRKLASITEDVLVYDDADQLTYATRGTTNSYVYDPAANRTQEVIAGAQTDFVYNNVNQMTSRSGAQGSATFTYDLNGSLTNDGTRTFEWDGANRMAAVTIGTHRSEFSYDGIGRRTRIVEKDNSVVTSDKRYVWCGGDLCEERDASGAVVQKRFFEQGEQAGTVNFFYSRDHLGNVRELMDYRGVMSTRYDYDAWGRQTKLNGIQDAALGYAGYFVHQPSGLLLTWYRAYDPNLARWISGDPIEEDGGMNLYTYVQNEPVSLLDPDGLKKLKFEGGREPGGKRTGPRLKGPVPQCNDSMTCDQLIPIIAALEVSLVGRFAWEVENQLPLDTRHIQRTDEERSELKNCLEIFAEKWNRGECGDCDPNKQRRGWKRYSKGGRLVPGGLPALNPWFHPDKKFQVPRIRIPTGYIPLRSGAQ